MHAYVLLRHDTPEGGWHFDWMLQPAPHAPLITFRVMHDPTDPAVHDFPAERLPDHRAAYLDYEGPVSNNRGRVTRIAAGLAAIVRDDADAIDIHLATPHPRHWRGVPLSQTTYTFRTLA